MNRIAPPDPWTRLRAHTTARIALGRSGASLPTREVLRLGVAHAQARDAVFETFDAEGLRTRLSALGFDVLDVESAAVDRASYLRRPDLGRQLSAASRARLGALRESGKSGKGDRKGEGGGDNEGTREGGDRGTNEDASGCDVLCVVADGLSAAAAHRHAADLLDPLRSLLERSSVTVGPIVLATLARVALGDEIGEALRARALVMLVGERPGLSSPDSLGAYVTWAPRRGRTDAERNCVSNIRPEGLPPREAAQRIAWLLDAARRLGASGVLLNDESDAAGEAPAGCLGADCRPRG